MAVMKAAARRFADSRGKRAAVLARAEADDAFVGVQPDPHPVGLDSRDQAQVRPETHRLDLGDLHRAHAFGRGLRKARPGPHSGGGFQKISAA